MGVKEKSCLLDVFSSLDFAVPLYLVEWLTVGIRWLTAISADHQDPIEY